MAFTSIEQAMRQSAELERKRNPLADGMTLRDYFAAKAMQGICVSKDESGTLLEHGYEWIAREAYRIADAMLKARDAS